MEKIQHNKPCVDEQELEALKKVIASNYLAQGSKVQQFEEVFADYLKMPYTVATNSGASALHLVLLALGVKKDDEVIVPTFVCTALLNAINYVGATPVIADINLETYGLSFEDTQKRITTKTKAIIIPYMFGIVFDIERFKTLKIPIIEDCAQALGAERNSKKVGSFGDMSIFSFYATKMITTGQGGMVASSQKEYIDVIRDLIHYDCRDDYKVRYNYQMTDLQASIGISQLKKLPLFLSRRRKISQQYHTILKNILQKTKKQDILNDMPLSEENAHYRYIIRLKTNVEKYITLFKKYGVEAKDMSDDYCFLHRYLELDPKQYPHAEALHHHLLSLPLYPALTDAEVKNIVNTLENIFGG